MRSVCMGYRTLDGVHVECGKQLRPAEPTFRDGKEVISHGLCDDCLARTEQINNVQGGHYER